MAAGLKTGQGCMGKAMSRREPPAVGGSGHLDENSQGEGNSGHLDENSWGESDSGHGIRTLGTMVSTSRWGTPPEQEEGGSLGNREKTNNSLQEEKH